MSTNASLMNLTRLAPIVSGAFLLAACGSDVSISPSGSGGAGGAWSSSSAGPGDTAGGSPMPARCGGPADDACPPEEWCDFADGLCGDDSAGVCAPRPDTCEDDCPGVCGCDGAFYCNACSASTAGVDTSALASCSAPESVVYSAEAWFGGLDHIFVHKADEARNICVRLHLTRPSENSLEFAFDLPPEWGVRSAQISGQASDCQSLDTPPYDEIVSALSGKGTLLFTIPPGGFFPCNISVHAALEFPKVDPWGSSSEQLDADGIVVENGCL